MDRCPTADSERRYHHVCGEIFVERSDTINSNDRPLKRIFTDDSIQLRRIS